MSSDDERRAWHREFEADGFRKFAEIGPLYARANTRPEDFGTIRRPTRPRVITPAARPPTAQLRGPRIRSVEAPSRRLLLRIESALRRQRAPVITIDDDPGTEVAVIEETQPAAPAPPAPPSPPAPAQPPAYQRPTYPVEVGGVTIQVPVGAHRHRVRIGGRKYALRLDARTGRIRFWTSRQIDDVITELVLEINII